MICEFTKPRSTHSLICDVQPSFFSTKIPPRHQQLKNYISARTGDFLYYAAEYEIYSVYLPTKKRTLVKCLKWKPFCLDAAHNWICVGGQNNGQCAFIQICKDPSDNDISALQVSQHADVDELLPLDLDPESRALMHQGSSTLRLPSIRRPRYELHEYELGDDIVNSVVVQPLPAGRDGLEDHVVAILTNNDKTILIFSLTSLDLLDGPGAYPTAMNHATISPDGNLLIAVGDEPQVYFSRRVFTEVLRKGNLCWSYQWRRICDANLSLTPREDCCFTTAFSPSGHICAAASQTGITTIFETSMIRENMLAENAVIGILRSSRLNTSSHRGAIRSMSFSPAPWDLLALAEDQGRVSVIDLRNVLQAEQTLELDTSSPKLLKIELQDQVNAQEQRQSEIEMQFLESPDEALSAQDHLAAVTNIADYMEYAADRRQRERNGLNNEIQALRSDTHRLTDVERQMIDAIGLRRLSATNVDPSTPTSVNYSSGANRFEPSSTPWNASGRQTASIAEYMRQRNLERPRPLPERSTQPRRRNSIVISNSNTAPSQTSANLAPIGTGVSPLSESPSQLPTTLTSLPDSTIVALQEPWHTITAAMGTNNDVLGRMLRIDATVANIRNIERRVQRSPGGSQPSQSQQLQTLQQLAARNEQQHRLNLLNAQRLSLLRSRHPSRVNDDNEEGVVTSDGLGRPDPRDGVTTMGVGWSPDGRKLYVATEVGIFEYKVNIDARKQFPGVAWA